MKSEQQRSSSSEVSQQFLVKSESLANTEAFYPQKSTRSANNGDNGGQYNKIFIGGLTYNTTDDMLKEFYEAYGEVIDCIVMRDPATKRSRGFGFVTYSEPTAVDQAMNARPHVIDGKTVEPKRAIPRDMSGKPETNVSVKKLYVSGIREEHSEQMFRDYFGQFGAVAEIDIITDKATGKKRGFAFVSFDDYDPVDKCVLQKSHMIDGKRCDVKKALSKEEIKKAEQQSRDRQERDMRSRGTARKFRDPLITSYYKYEYDEYDPSGSAGGMTSGGNGGGGDWSNGGYGNSAGGNGGYSSGGWNQGQQGQWNQGANQWGAAGGQGQWNQSQGYAGGYSSSGYQSGYGQSAAATTGGAAGGYGQTGWQNQGNWSAQPNNWGQQAAAPAAQQPAAAQWNQAAPQGWQGQVSGGGWTQGGGTPATGGAGGGNWATRR